MLKQCPKCRRSYGDVELNYCLEDGARLENEWDGNPTIPMQNPAIDGQNLPKRKQSFRRTAILRTGVLGLVGLLTVVVFSVWWFSGLLFSEVNKSVVEPSTATPAALANTDNAGWIFLKEVGSPDFKIEYLWRENTFKLRFTNNDSMKVQMKYRLRADLNRTGRGWTSSGWLDATVTINAKATQLDNFPVPTETEEIRNVEVDVVDWEYYPVNK